MLSEENSHVLDMLRKSNEDTEPRLVKHLPYITPVTDGVIMCRDGDLMASFAVEGINADTSDATRVWEIGDAFSRLIAQEEDNIGYYVHRISSKTKPTIDPIEGEGFSAEIDRRWADYIQNIGLRNRTNMVTIVMRPNRITGFFSKISKNNDLQRDKILERANVLDKLVKATMDTLGTTKPRRMLISEGEWLGQLRAIISGQYSPLDKGVKFTPINDLISNTDVNFKGDLITLYGTSSDTLRYAGMLTIKGYPSNTFPGIFDALNLPFDMVVTNSFTRMDNITALSRIQRMIKQRLASEDAAISLVEELERAADDLASGRVVFGNHHVTVCVFGDSEQELDRGISLATRAITEAQASAVRERYDMASSFFAQHPSNFSYRNRPSMISSRNFGELAALHGSSSGNYKDESPWGECVSIIPTGRDEPYRFNFHLSGNKDDRTLGHTIVLGQPGSGKTLGTAFLMSQASRLAPRMIVFDKDRGLESPVRAMGGEYSAVQLGKTTGFNPFRAESDERGSAWLADWLQSLAEGNGGDLNPVQIEAISNAVRGNMQAQEALQNFEQFRTQFRSIDDNKDLYTRLGRWSGTGQYSWLFDGTNEDSLSLSSDIIGFDLTEIFDNDAVRTAWLSYVFRRIERLVEDERRTIIVLDEAWKLLDDPYFERILKDWMLTMRKKNVVVILLTQRVSHLAESAAGDAILETAVTKLIYPNSANKDDELKPLGLTDLESNFLKSSNVGNRLALLKSGEDSVVLDFDLYALGGGIGVLGGGQGAKFDPEWRTNPDFWQELM